MRWFKKTLSCYYSTKAGSIVAPLVKQGDDSKAAQDMAEGRLEFRVPTMVLSTGSPEGPDGLSKYKDPANQMGQPATDSLSDQSRVIETSLGISRSREEFTAASLTELQKGGDAMPASAKVKPWREGDGFVNETEGEDNSQSHAVLKELGVDADGPAPGGSMEPGLERSPERAPQLGRLSWDKELAGKPLSESHPGITEQTVPGSLLEGGRVPEVGVQEVDSETTPAAEASVREVHDSPSAFMAPSGPETREGAMELRAVEEAGQKESPGGEGNQEEVESVKIPFIWSPGLPSPIQATDTIETVPLVSSTVTPTPLGDAQTPTPAVLDAHSPLTPDHPQRWTTVTVGLSRPGPLENRKTQPSMPTLTALTLETEQGPSDGASISGLTHQDGVLENYSRPLFKDPEPGPSPLSSKAGMLARPTDDTALEDTPMGLEREETLSTEDLPLLFEPLDDAEAMVTLPPGGSLPALHPSHGLQQEAELVDIETTDANRTLSEDSFPALPDLPSMAWQMSGSEITDAVSSPVLLSLTVPPSGSPLKNRSPDSDENGLADTATEPHPIFIEAPPPIATGPTFLTTVAKATGLPGPKPKSGLEELEYEEEHDEDEEDEDTDDSEEEESQEEETEALMPAPTPPAYSHVPRPPLWVQRNHGLVRSWVEKIRDEAGYVSGMLAPVGIGIAGALFILGILYSIRAVHRKRRNNIKQQRRKQREMTSRQDQAMLLADSSEDEL
ncbi:hypothetical protein AGOR_G00087890 [Albula goreensis]|uniref:Armadillo-like helical domain-containing protein 4 n=1 Tax=Albula goreensis TaxID=1534307 RepID=A0A8T3DRB3_9TELE|nr:hypothetical protein AGOR_G00087890 [Albula goreensis]